MGNQQREFPAVKLWGMFMCIAFAALALLVGEWIASFRLSYLKYVTQMAAPTILIAAGVALTFAAGGLDLSFFGVSALCAGSIYYCRSIGDGKCVAVTLLLGLAVGAVNGLCAWFIGWLIGKVNRWVCALVSLVIGVIVYFAPNRALLSLPFPLRFNMLQGGALSISISQGALMMTPLLALLICALFCFAPGGNRLFAQEREQDRPERMPVSGLLAYCASGFLTAFAMVIIGMKSLNFNDITYEYMLGRIVPEVLITLALALVGMPNFRESKREAFAGLLSVFFGGISVSAVTQSLQMRQVWLFLNHRLLYELLTFAIIGVAGGIAVRKLIELKEAAAAGDADAAGGYLAQPMPGGSAYDAPAMEELWVDFMRPMSTGGVSDALENLRDLGALSEEEYRRKRAELTSPR